MDPETQSQEMTEPQLMEMALKADSGLMEDDQPAAPATPAPGEEVKPGDAPAPKDAVQKQPEPAEKKSEEPGTEEAQSRYAKERERQDRSWKKLEEDKEALRREKEEIAKAKEEVSSQKAKASVYRDANGYSAEDYEAFANSADDPELSKKARERAEALRKEETESKQRTSQDEFVKGWQKNLEEVLDSDPDLKDQESEAGKALAKLLREIPIFSMAPDGIKHAAAFAKAQREASSVPGFKAEIQRLTTEIERLNKLTAPGGGGPNAKPSTKSLDEMSEGDRLAALQRIAAEADSATT